MKHAIRARFPDVRHLSTDALAEWMASDERVPPVLLDAREPEEYAVSHLPGAVIAPSAGDAVEALEGYEKDHPVVVYCSVGYRSAMLAEKLAEEGFTDVANLEGSLFQWANEGRLLLAGEDTVNVAHPYDETWGRLLEPELRSEGKAP